VAVQDVRWVEVGSQPVDDYIFFYENANHHLGTGYFMHKVIIQQIR